MITYRLPGKFSQRVFAPNQTIEREGVTLHRFDISTTDRPHKWFNENQLALIEDNMPIAPVFQGQAITIGELNAVYSHYIDAKKKHLIHVDGDKDQSITVSEEWLQQIPDGCPLPTGAQLKGAGLGQPKTIVAVCYPFYKVAWNNGFNAHNQSEWLRDDQMWQTSNLLGTVHKDPYTITLPEIEMTNEPVKPEPIAKAGTPDIEKALYEEMLSKIEILKAQLAQHDTEFARITMENERLKRDLEKAKHTPAPVNEVDAIKSERDSLKAQVAELTLIRKERDQLRSQLAMQAQEAPQEAVCDEFAIVRNESPAGMAKRRKQGYTPIHMQFEGGKLHVVYEKSEDAIALPSERYAAIAISTHPVGDYVSALGNKSVGAEELSAIGNAAIFEAGAKAWGSK